MEIDKVVDHKHTKQQQQQQQQQQSPQAKKQIRRRLHTNKPYQERLLNMAEARREIATALKFHRASMKQQQVPGNYDPQTQPPQQQERKSNYFGPYSGLSHPHHWHISTNVPPPPPPPMNYDNNLNLVLPNQTLGLNLNYQDFSNLNTRIYRNPEPVCSSSSASSSYSNSSSAAKEADMVEFSGVKERGLLRAEEDRKCGNSHEDDHHLFEQVMEFPPWLINANESSCLQHIFEHNYSHEYSPDPALPCMDIGEIEGMDGEWLA